MSQIEGEVEWVLLRAKSNYSRCWRQGGGGRRTKSLSLFIHLVYNGDMKADGNSLACVEKSELGWYVILCFQKMKDTQQRRR